MPQAFSHPTRLLRAVQGLHAKASSSHRDSALAARTLSGWFRARCYCKSKMPADPTYPADRPHPLPPASPLDWKAPNSPHPPSSLPVCCTLLSPALSSAVSPLGPSGICTAKRQAAEVVARFARGWCFQSYICHIVKASCAAYTTIPSLPFVGQPPS